MATPAPISTADLLILSASEIDEAAALYKEEQDKAAAREAELLAMFNAAAAKSEQDTFAIFNGQCVQVLEFHAMEVLISHKCGEEEFVNFNQLDFLD